MKKFLVIVIFLVIVMVGYILFFNFGLDSGLISKSPCEVPCWQKLIPNRTTEKDINIFLTNLNFENLSTKSERITSTGCREIYLEYKSDTINESGHFLYIKDGKLTLIQSIFQDLHLIFIPYIYLGRPEYYESVLANGPEGEVYFSTLIYPQRGIAIDLMQNEKLSGIIHPFMTIKSVEYFSPGSINNYLEYKYSCDIEGENLEKYISYQFANFIFPWDGFGRVETGKTK